VGALHSGGGGNGGLSCSSCLGGGVSSISGPAISGADAPARCREGVTRYHHIQKR
jgi:hypothetical protein